MKKRYIVITLLVILIMVGTAIYIKSQNMIFGEQLDFRKVYSGEEDISYIKVYTNELSKDSKRKLIYGKEDMLNIINEIANVKVKRVWYKNEDWIGARCRLVIENTKTNNTVYVRVNNKQITIRKAFGTGEVTYKIIDSDISNRLAEIIFKYDNYGAM